MNLANAIHLSGLISAVVAIVGLIIALFNIGKVLATFRRQMTLKILAAYTERFESLMDTFPERTILFRLNKSDLPDQNEKLTLSVLKYLNLCSEEIYLKDRSYFETDMWEIWGNEMTRMLASSLVRREWPRLRREFDSHPEFQQYVEQIQSQRADAS